VEGALVTAFNWIAWGVEKVIDWLKAILVTLDLVCDLANGALGCAAAVTS
jgi:hypothetical protein